MPKRISQLLEVPSSSFAIGFSLSVALLAVQAFSDARSECNALTDSIHTRVAWLEGGHMWNLNPPSNAIRGFDSKTGQVHTIWNGECVKCVLCAGGHKVLLTDLQYKIWIVDWDGTNARKLTSGRVSDVWTDSEGKEWAIYRASATTTGGGIYRVLIDDPTQKVELYNGQEGHNVYTWFQVSADGKRAASFFPHGGANGGVLNLENGALTKLTDGCWSGMASDNSYYWFRLDWGHTTLVTFKDLQSISSFNALPPITPSGQMYCPRPADGPKYGGRFFTLCGGYPGYNQNGNTIEVFLGKFNSNWTGIDGWVRITNNDVPEVNPCVWVGVEPEQTSIILSNSKITFNAQEGAGNPSSKNVTASPTGSQLEEVSVSSNKSWLWVSLSQSGSNWIVQNRVDISGLGTGLHTARVSVSASNAVPNSEAYEVELTIEDAPTATEIETRPTAAGVSPGERVVVFRRIDNSLIEIKLPQPGGAYTVEVFNMLGDRISRHSGISRSIRVITPFGINPLANGIYWFKLTHHGKSRIKRIQLMD